MKEGKGKGAPEVKVQLLVLLWKELLYCTPWSPANLFQLSNSQSLRLMCQSPRKWHFDQLFQANLLSLIIFQFYAIKKAVTERYM